MGERVTSSVKMLSHPSVALPRVLSAWSARTRSGVVQESNRNENDMAILSVEMKKKKKKSDSNNNGPKQA